jgi:hypothetical protein
VRRIVTDVAKNRRQRRLEKEAAELVRSGRAKPARTQQARTQQARPKGA